MKNFEDPIQFQHESQFEGVPVVYFDLMEIAQGGPEIGNLSVGGKVIEGRFGGPLRFDNGYIYVPIFVKRFLGTGFRLARINIKTHQLELTGKIKDLIFLARIEGSKIYFYEDMNKSNERYCEF